MNAEQKWHLFQIKPGHHRRVAIDPKDPKGIRAIQTILKKLDGTKAQGH